LTQAWRARGKPPLLALDRVGCQFPAGKVTSIIGPSGCGKTTLLLMIRGLLAPTSGTIAFRYAGDNGPIDGPAASMATVWQGFNLLPWRTVLDNVTLGLELKGMPRKLRHEAARRALAAVDLSGFEDKYPRQLSGGMRQRVGLARALVQDPDVLLLDEPFGALDAQTRLLLQEQMAGLVETTRKTVILVTHSIEEAILLGDRVLVMTARPGRIALELAVTLERPRRMELTHTPAFGEIFDAIYGRLKSEVERSMVLAS
jgi:NitT/TauT family transport system ATP-binding protein